MDDENYTTDELIDEVIDGIEMVIEGDFENPDCTRKDAVSDVQVRLGFLDRGADPRQWLEVANEVYERYDIDDWEYNRALGRVMKPGKVPSEPASSYNGPANVVPMGLVGELIYPAVGVAPDY